MGDATLITPLAIACAIFAPVIASGQDLSQPVKIATPISDTLFGRIDTNVRGPASGSPEVISMTPARYNARTLTDRPALYWFLSRNTESAVRFALREVANRVSTTVLECEVRGPIAAGVHTIRLADHGVMLRSDRRYSWFVRFESADARDPVYSTSFIDFGDQSGASAMRVQLSGASPQARYEKLAAVYWYDALATIVGLVGEAPQSRDYRNRYAELLRHAQLDDVAVHVMTAPQVVASTCGPARRP